MVSVSSRSWTAQVEVDLVDGEAGALRVHSAFLSSRRVRVR
jgi:hypothetical protein